MNNVSRLPNGLASGGNNMSSTTGSISTYSGKGGAVSAVYLNDTPLIIAADMPAAIKKYGPKDENGIGQKMIISESEPKMIFVKPLVKDWKDRINIL